MSFELSVDRTQKERVIKELASTGVTMVDTPRGAARFFIDKSIDETFSHYRGKLYIKGYVKMA